MLAPIAFGCAAAIATNTLLPHTDGTLTAIARSLVIVAVSSIAVWSVDRFARKLLPLAALMQLSLVFPDQAPSRMRSALRSGSSRRLARTLEETRKNGLAPDPGDAARQVVDLIGAIGDHDRRTRGHSERVRLFADLMGQELKLSKEDRQKLQWGALLHDLGKLMVPTEILNKAGKPTAEEWQILEGHPDAGMALIAPLREFLGEWVHAIGGHHEKWDGTGYPQGLAGRAIPRAATIVAVADSFEVMTAVRSYKKAMPLAEARAELTRCAGTHFAPEAVRAMLSISLGQLRIVSGPLASLAHLPFLGSVMQSSAALTATAPALGSAVLAPIAALATVATMGAGVAPVTTPPPAELASVEIATPASPGSGPAATDVQPTGSEATTTNGADTATPPAEGPPAEGPATEVVAADGSTSAASTGGDTVPDGLTDSGRSAAPSGVSTTTRPSSPGQGSPASPGQGPPSTPPSTPHSAPHSTPAPPPSVTTTTRPATTTTAPPTTIAAPTTTSNLAAFTISASTNSLRLAPVNLHGASFPRSTKIYVSVWANLSKVEYTYPGGDVDRGSFPFDLMGPKNLFEANGFTLPSTPGTYSIVAEGQRDGNRRTVTATFTVT